MEIANVVASIISAFGSGRALYQRMLGKKQTGRGRLATVSEVDTWLRESLDNRPLEIERSYQQHVRRHGHRYEMGDSIAHSSLAHILLTLNSGLIKVINRFLSRESSMDDLSRRTLLSLSEMAAADTLDTLSQLSLRLKSEPAAAGIPAALKAGSPRSPKQRRADDKKSKEPRRRGGSSKAAATATTATTATTAAAADHTPLPPAFLIRGAWVRTKTSGSASSPHSKSSAVKMIPASKPQRIRKESALLRAEDKKRGTPKKSRHTEECEKSYGTKSSPGAVRQKGRSAEARREKEPGSTSDEEPARSYHRPRPISMGTIYTASTKVGEIPESRFSQKLQPVQECSYDPRLVEYLMTLPDPSESEADEPRKLSRGMRFWKRDRRRVVEAA